LPNTRHLVFAHLRSDLATVAYPASWLEREPVGTACGLVGEAPSDGECDDVRRDVSEPAIGVPRHEAESRQCLVGAAGVVIGDDRLSQKPSPAELGRDAVGVLKIRWPKGPCGFESHLRHIE
jgi:hypothetical protein